MKIKENLKILKPPKTISRSWVCDNLPASIKVKKAIISH